MINICSTYFFRNNAWKEDVQTLLHEMTHITVMLQALWDGFRDSDGNTINESEVFSYDSEFETQIVHTPILKSLVQAHYNCSQNNILPGLPVQNGTGHWHLQYAHSETMTSIIYGGTHAFSKFTLALMVCTYIYIYISIIF